MLHHWQEENGHFRRELENWQKFRDIQQKFKHLDRLETQLELSSALTVLITTLTRLSDWQEFEVFQYQILDDALGFEDHCRRGLANMTKWEVTTEQSPISSAAHDAIGPWLRPFNYSQEEIEAAKKQLKWIQDQWPKAVAEAIQSVSMRRNFDRGWKRNSESRPMPLSTPYRSWGAVQATLSVHLMNLWMISKDFYNGVRRGRNIWKNYWIGRRFSHGDDVS